VTAVVDHRAGRCDLGLHRGQVCLAAEAGVDGHDQQQVDQVQRVLDEAQPGGGREGDTGPHAEFTDGCIRAVRLLQGLGMHDDQFAARLDVGRQHVLRSLAHQVRFKAAGGMRPAGRDDVGPEGQVWHEVPVHHIPLDAIDAGGVQRGAVGAEAGEVGWQHRRDDLGGHAGLEGRSRRGQRGA